MTKLFTSAPSINPMQRSSDSKFAWIISLAFWLMLFTASAMYALVALAPRWIDNMQLVADKQANKRRLLALEQEVEDMNTVLVAVESDPEFKAELARLDFSVKRPGDEDIPVDERYLVDARSRAGDIQAEPILPWHAAFVRPFAESDSLRRLTLFAAAVLTIVAFTFVQESQEAQLRTSLETVRDFIQATKNRYRKT